MFQASPPTSCPNEKPERQLVTTRPGLPRAFPGFALTIPCPGKCLYPRLGTVGSLESTEMLPSLSHHVQSVTRSCQLLRPVGSPGSPRFSFPTATTSRRGRLLSYLIWVVIVISYPSHCPHSPRVTAVRDLGKGQTSPCMRHHPHIHYIHSDGPALPSG